MERLRVAVLFGGASSEYEVSLLSAASVLRNIPKDRFETINIGITKQGRWYKYAGAVESIENGAWTHDIDNLTPCILSPDRGVHGVVTFAGGSYRNERVDVVFPVLHGKNGEDGTLQGLLTLAGVPFVGCGTLSSAVCMDKAVTSTLLDAAGIPHTPWAAVLPAQLADFDALATQLEQRLGYPMFVKPANAGSSVGVTKAHDKGELRGALDAAFRYDGKAVVERTVVGKELEIAVCGNDRAAASAVGEIVPCNEFYDYDAKYLANKSEALIPARISDAQAREIKERAVEAYRALGCAGLARIDFLLEEATGKIFLNEPNTIPGFTSISMYPKLMAASGVPYSELIARLIDLAVERAGESR
ncbi:MAG: D-alanine--D-alanine ligase family protein [Oscillospiraceae bacterium]|nr:D-alanine--D-alanine ligase family protein [Oscillospiraceae bacterium]